MKKLLVLSALFLQVIGFAQDDLREQTQLIVEEGKRLYRSEMASWYGTDIFLEKVKDRSIIGGYFSYVEDELAKCVFFSKTAEPVVIGTIAFDSTYSTQTAQADYTERAFSAMEQDIYIIRKKALEIINSDTLFKTYNNTSLNLVPLVTGDAKKVYVLTGPSITGVVIFGNDYLLTFDKDNNLVEKKQLHRNIITVEYGKQKEGEEILETVHSHLPETGEFITATDICTLMLYARFAKWNAHLVISKSYLNRWDCKSNQLAVIPMDAIEKIRKNEEKSKKKKKRKG